MNQQNRENELGIMYNKPYFEIRREMAYLQEKKYMNFQQEIAYKKVKEIINEWINTSENIKEVIGDQIEVLSYDDLMNENGEGKINKSEVGVYRKKIERACEKSGDRAYYIWVTFRVDGMVLTVGKTSFIKKNSNSYGDLFTQLGRRGIGTSKLLDLFSSYTEKLIINTTLDTKEIERCNQIIKEYDMMLKRINNILRNYIARAIIIPINIQGKDYKESNSISLSLEKKLGEYLIGKDIPILNYYSHK